MSEIESEFVNAFVQRNRRNRFLKLLSSEKSRPKLRAKLGHLSDLTTTYVRQLPPNQQSSKIIYDVLRQLGAPEQCYLISEDKDLDQKLIQLNTALDEVVGFGMGTIILCIPKRLAYYEAEGKNQRFILYRK